MSDGGLFVVSPGIWKKSRCSGGRGAGYHDLVHSNLWHYLRGLGIGEDRVAIRLPRSICNCHFAIKRVIAYLPLAYSTA